MTIKVLWQPTCDICGKIITEPDEILCKDCKKGRK